MIIHALFKLFVSLGSEWVLVLLVALSVVVLAVALERLHFFRRRERAGRYFWQENAEGWLQNGVPENWAEQSPAPAESVEAQLVHMMLNNSEASAERKNHLSDAVLQSEKLRLETRLAILGTLGNNAPYLGLIGTVIGVIRAFASLSTQSNSASSSLNAAMAEALVSTAVGIAVALEAVVLFNYFNRKTKLILERASVVRDLLMAGARGGA